MKPQLIRVFTDPTSSFSVRANVMPDKYNQYHYHHEIEIVYIQQGSGTYFIGESIHTYSAGDVIIIGSNLPHLWKCDENCDAGSQGYPTKATVLHFDKNFWGSAFLDLQENIYIKTLLKRAQQGIYLTGETKEEVAQVLQKMPAATGSEKIILLLHILNTIALCNNLSFFSSNLNTSKIEDEDDRINDVLRYSIRNFNRRIELDEIAAVAYISPNSFCRFFKLRTKKTYSQYLIELRVNHACKLLKENKLNSKQVCSESGFNNFANFHKCFKQITGKSPVEYQKLFKSASVFA